MAAPKTPGTFVVGTRKSNLALTQTQYVADELALRNAATFPVRHMTTVGDRNQTTPLHLLQPYQSGQPAKSLWTDELESALLDGRFDVLVHSCKDVPTQLRDGCEIACLLERHDPRDAFVVKKGLPYKTLRDLPKGAVIGTGSVRRIAQLARAYPDLEFADMRGNLNTRLSKLDAEDSPFAALILAISGLDRLGAGDRITCPIEFPDMMHSVGQGALAVESRSGDAATRDVLRSVGHWPTEWRVGAERGLLRVLEGGCSVPVGVETALTEVDAATPPHYAPGTYAPPTAASPLLHFSGILPADARFPLAGEDAPLVPRRAKLNLKASVTSTDGRKQVVYEPGDVVVSNYQEAVAWGEECARQMRVIGAGEILDEIEAVRKAREAEIVRQSAEELARRAELDDTEGQECTRPGKEKEQWEQAPPAECPAHEEGQRMAA